MNVRSHLVRPRRFSALLLSAACAWALGGCAANSGGTGGQDGVGGTSLADAGSSSSGGATGTGGANGAGGATGTGGASATGGARGFGGSIGAGGSPGSGTGGSSSGFGGSSSGFGGASSGFGGASSGFGGSSSGAGGSSSGAGGSSSGAGGSREGTGGAGGAAGPPGNGGRGSGGATGTGGATATGGSTGSAGGPSGGSSFCPQGAVFCADFEEASGVPSNSPVGTATFSDPSEYGTTFGGSNAVMVLDPTAPYAGAQSLKIDPSSGFSVRTLAVTVPQTFWVRLYIKSDKAIGQPDHNSFFGAGVDPNYSKGKFVEVSEQFSCILLNQSDTLFPAGTTCGPNTALAANQWHCMAAQFDGATGNVQVYAGTTKIIDAAAWAPARQTFTTFSFGYFAYNANSATVWYDNVVVSPNPLSCP